MNTADTSIQSLQDNVELALLGHKQFLYTEKTRGTTHTVRNMALLDEDHIKQCSCCDSYMTEGYVIGEGHKYYCDLDCLEMDYTKEEVESLKLGEDDSENYWTSWDEIPTDYNGKVFQEYLATAEVGEVWENATEKYTRTI